MIQNEREIRHESVLQAVRQMMIAARTAPKGKGIDIIELAMVTDEDIKRLSEEMIKVSEETGMKFFLRDADNILQAEAVLLLGTRQRVQGLNCGHCGFSTCEGKPFAVPCAINSVDLGIAIGSACATAADWRLDTRVMFSAGLAAQRLGILDGCKCVMAIPVSAASKNPFFDRKPKTT
ncbi:MAG: ferredoxin [Parabacteroides sp.]|nr:ferredoxin [Parabacteroides sp.]